VVAVWDDSADEWLTPVTTVASNDADTLTLVDTLSAATAVGDSYFIGTAPGPWAWAFDPGVNLTTWGPPASPADVKVMDGGRPYTDSYGACHPAFYIADNGCVPDRFIEIQSRAPLLGDCEVEVWTCTFPATPGAMADCCPVTMGKQVADAEKKWGELNYSKLDVHIDDLPEEFMDFQDLTWLETKAAVLDDLEEWTEADDHEVTVDSGTCEEGFLLNGAAPQFESDCMVYDLMAEQVWAEYLQVPEVQPAGGAVVNWWLVKDTEDNQEWIQDLMDDIVARAGSEGFRGHMPGEDDNDYWSATGKYNPALDPQDLIMEWVDGTLDGEERMAENTILLSFVPHEAWDPYLYKDTMMGEVGVIEETWYGRSLTMDQYPGEIPGVSMAVIGNFDAEDVMVVTLVRYQQNYNAENLVLIEIGKKHFVKPPPPSEVKTTQVRWAGEKIVLEKDWSDVIDPLGKDGKYIAVYHLESQSIGELAEAGAYFDQETTEGDIWVAVDCDHPISRVILESEVQGEADVNVHLYEECGENSGMWLFGPPVANAGFIVYYLYLEEVTPWDTSPEPVAPDEDAVFPVDVKGCFWTTSLPPTTRAARTITFESDTGTQSLVLPAGRYVLPDDWPLMAGPNWREFRPWMDLMADPGNVSSTYELGPYDGGVNSTSGIAELPCIGPFSALQQWSITDLWISDAMVPADDAVDMDPFTVGNQNWEERNTVIPDDWLSPFDCPMPPAEIHFHITAATPPVGVTPSLTEAFKDTGPTYDWPFYASEIPANPFIPPMLGTVNGYWWDSWEFGSWAPEDASEREGPYWFFWDLEQTPLVDGANTKAEAYSDNLATCAVFIDALGGYGTVTIKAIADYPYLPAKYGAVESVEVTQRWGAIELNPHFQANKTDIEVGDTVTFTNMTAAGQPPYLKAEWDLDGDGQFDDEVYELALGENVMAAAQWTYTAPGIYTIGLRMTDSSPNPPRFEYRYDYITVTGPAPEFDPWDYDVNDDGVISKAEALAAVADYFGGDITKANALEVIALYFA